MMKSLACAILLAAAALGESPAPQPQVLNEGRYLVAVSGMLCHACARAIELELAKLPEVEAVRADFERERVSLAVRKGQALKVSALRKGLRRAAQRVNLDTDFEIAGVSPAP